MSPDFHLGFLDGRAAERLTVVTWLDGAPERIAAQKANGAREIHPQHTAGMLAACAALARAIARGEHIPGKSGEK